MHPVACPSHYGQKVTLDQCGRCGGIWFDAFELFKVKLGEAQDIEARNIEAQDIEVLDSDSLRTPSHIDNPTLRCPRDKIALVQYEDPNFPEGLILSRCPKCTGFWLNRGEFSKYQTSRQKLKISKEKTLEDQKLGEDVKRLLASGIHSGSTETLGNLGAYLSQPAHTAAFSSFGASQGAGKEESPLDTILSVLITLLRVFVFKS